jgi:L-alanine-DL-glutamate epimerase-like enolase superfamily enzyme
MTKSTDIRLLEISCETESFDYRTPIKFGGRAVNDVTLLHVRARVETRDGRSGEGFGSMPMGNIWGWPSATVSADDTLAGMVNLGEQLVRQSNDYTEYGHPLEITHDLAALQQQTADAVVAKLNLGEPIPRLAQLVAASPLEAAVHDAYGKTLGENSYNLLGPEFANRDIAHYLDDQFAGEYLDQYTLRKPKASMPLYHLVGALDPLTEADLSQRLDDGYPETLSEWINADGLTHMKIKLNGDNLDWDVERVVAIERIAAETQAGRGCSDWFYSADFNEKCANVDYILAFLAGVGEKAPAALEQLQYIEQPTSRDLRANPENRMHKAAKIKPVVIDEALVDYESLLLSREQGYSGVALKACKGHSEAILMGAAAQKFGMFLCVQDLTCPGYSFLHSASLSARIPTVAAIEGNGRQYCPIANRGWEDRYPGMFHFNDGTLKTELLDKPGLF